MTAVEWLMDKYITQNGVIAAADYHTAKEMEKKQIIEAHGDKLKKSSGVTNFEYWFSGEDYYKQKFKQDGN